MSIGAGPQPSNFPQGFANGLSVRGIPLAQTHPGKAFWLGNGSALAPHGRPASDNNDGTFASPFATLQGAINKCLAGRGDVIFVKAGHAENIASATALDLNKAGVAIIGLGTGSSRPTFTLTTANTATITVSAASCSFQNCTFTANFLNIAALFTLTAGFFSLEACDVNDTAANLNFLKVFDTNTTDGSANGLCVRGNRFRLLATSGAVMLLSVNGTTAYVTVQDNYYQSATTGTGAVIPIATGKILTTALILRNIFNLVNAAGTATGYLITTDGTTNTGFIDGNKDTVLCTVPLPVTLTSGFRYGLHHHADAADRCGYLVPVADS